MCGIVGFISKNEQAQASARPRFMRHALALDTLRGEDSTGVFTIHKKGQSKMRHSLKNGIKFVSTKSFDALDLHGWAAVGHNRAATKGNVTIKNAHPFKFGDITLVHNGTLRDSGRSLATYKQSLEVDSMQIALALSSAPPDQATKILENIYGSFALVWYDARDKSLNVARNRDRPLHFTYNSDRTVMWFMSDGDHLKMVNKSFMGHQASGSVIYKSKPNTMMKFKFGSLVPEMLDFKDYVVPSVYSKSKKGLASAAEKWKGHLKEYQQRNGPLKEAVRVEINGKKRSIPKAMRKVLDQLFGLEIGSYLEFLPLSSVETHHNRYMVSGEMVLPEWGDATWPAILYDVKKLQVNAYKDNTWLVHPIGVTHSTQPDTYDYSILGSLIHCKYDDYKEALKRDEELDKESGILVPGPEGEMIMSDRLATLVARGCVQCGYDIYKQDIKNSIIVNDGQDILCADCVDSERYNLPYGPNALH